jgi:asparagine synthase (glutamine-hydrolysing)
MCGISGFVDASKTTDEELLKKMNDEMIHRGPDDRGSILIQTTSTHIGLSHRRLSIIDTSVLGHQPMLYEHLSLVYNGEVYNFAEIKSSLLKAGYTFQSTSDTEVVLKAFHLYGIEAVNLFNGMFAIALYDKNEEALYLVRDRIGVKPLYYYALNKHFVFASELKPIMAYPAFEKKINTDALNLFLAHGYITGPVCIFEHVQKLEPGCYLKYKAQKIEIINYWSIQKQFENKTVSTASESTLLKGLDNLVTDAIQLRMIADVPIGSFLSGGIDSSLVSAVMQKNSNTPINTFTIGFEEKKYNEASYAKEIADFLKTNHHELYLPIKEVKELVHNIPHFYDEPFADSSQLPTMLVSKFARQHVTVALSGDGGDEFFCGYSRYDTVQRAKKMKPLGRILNTANKIINLEGILDKVDRRFIKGIYNNSDANIINQDYLSTNTHLKGLVLGSKLNIESKYFDITCLSENIQEAHMLQDMVTYLPDDICTKVDRASMSVSLEAREPLLDYRIAEYSFTVPHAFKYKNGVKKHLLKELAYQYIPKHLLDRPKMGFGVPVYEWLHTDLHYLVDETLNLEYIQKQGIFDENKILVLVAKFESRKHHDYYARLIWHLVVFQIWYKEYMD